MTQNVCKHILIEVLFSTFMNYVNLGKMIEGYLACHISVINIHYEIFFHLCFNVNLDSCLTKKNRYPLKLFFVLMFSTFVIICQGCDPE